MRIVIDLGAANDPDGLIAETGPATRPDRTCIAFRQPPGRAAGETWKVAVKVIDPRGAEGLRVLTEDAAWG